MLMRDEVYIFNWNDFYLGTIAGLLMCTGKLLIAVAVVIGIAGPA